MLPAVMIIIATIIGNVKKSSIQPIKTAIVMRKARENISQMQNIII